MVYHRCDVSKLTPETLLALNKEWEAIGAFRDSLEKLAEDIPPEIEDAQSLQLRLAEKADKMFKRWREDNKNWSKRIKDLFSGDLDDAAKVLDKLVEKGFGAEPPAGTAVGGGAVAGLTSSMLGGSVTYHALLGAGAGLAVELILRTGKNIAAKKKRRREDPLRYLTMMEKAGVSYITSN